MAVAAERFGNRADETDFAAAVEKTIARGDFAAVLGIERLQRPACVNAVAQFGGQHDPCEVPIVAGAHVHILDETRHMAVLAREFDQRQDLIVVDAALHHAVEFDALEACGNSSIEATEHRIHIATVAGQGCEQCWIACIQTDRQAMQARLTQRARLRGEQTAVGGEREVFDAIDRRQPRD